MFLRCPQCGATLSLRSVGGRASGECPTCGIIVEVRQPGRGPRPARRAQGPWALAAGVAAVLALGGVAVLAGMGREGGRATDPDPAPGPTTTTVAQKGGRPADAQVPPQPEA